MYSRAHGSSWHGFDGTGATASGTRCSWFEMGKDSTSSHMRHIEIKYFYARDIREAGQLTMIKIDTKEQIADLLSKALPIAQFIVLRDRMVQSASQLPSGNFVV